MHTMYGGPNSMPGHSMGMIGPINPGSLGMMDPSSNNQPLQFNMNKGKPPMPGPVNEASDIDERVNVPVSPPVTTSPNVGGPLAGHGPGMMGHMQGPMQGPWGPMMPPSLMAMDPGMMMNMAYGQYPGFMGPMGPMDGPPMPKEIITLKSVTLYPPPPNAPPPSTRERPPGCRTIFVGGLPENMTEDIMHEIFDKCGPISSLRMSKKNFCHIRYDMEECVERALYLSGFRMKVGNKDDKPNTGRVHIDYAQARDDLYEWECKNRTYAREERHRMRHELDQLRPPSPPPVIHYSDHEASILLEKIKSDDTFTSATQVLITWLNRGDCNRRSAGMFYSMIQSVNAHLRRLLNEKQQHDEELENIKIQFQHRHNALIKQFEQVENVFNCTSKQKAWDHFSKAQRKNLDLWRKQAKEISQAQRDEFLNKREEAEMEMSDSEDQAESFSAKRKKITDPAEYAQAAMIEWQSNQLKEENDSLKCQLEAYVNEIDLVKHENKATEEGKDKQIKALQQALQGMQQQLFQSKIQMKKDEEEISKLKTKIAISDKMKAKKESEKVAKKEGESETGDGNSQESEETTNGQIDSSQAEPDDLLGYQTTLPEKEARILSLLATFLHVHPFGASLDYIWSYLHRLEIKVRTSELEDLLERYPSLFKLDIYGVGASIEKRWKFIGFDQDRNLDVVLVMN